MLAKAATTVDRISGGRVDLGMGAGWWEEEHRSHGLPFPPTAERLEMLEEQLEIVHGLWSEGAFSFESRHYALEECRFVPKPVQSPHPPIIVGGKGGPRIAGLAARWADEFNRVGGTPTEVREAFARVRAAVERDCIVGTVERAVDRMNARADAGVQRFVLNHGLFDDFDQIELFADDVLPRVPA